MKTKLLFFLFFLLCKFSNAQYPDWIWANSSAGNNYDLVKAVTADVYGNVYVAGSFSSDSLRFGSFTLVNSGMGSGTYDMFIVKYDASGNVLWATSAGGSDSDYGSAIAVDSSGNIYIGGSYRSDYISFGSITLTNSGPPYSDFFVVKYSPSGNVLWANTSKNSISSDASYSLCTDNFGNVYFTGPYQSNTITIGTTTLINPGAPNRDSYIVKYSPSGDVLWVDGVGGWNDDAVNSIRTDAQGNLVACGYFFSSTLMLGGTTLTNSTPGTSDLFVAKFDASGNVLWAKRAGGNDSDYGSSVASDTAGNVYMGGSFRSNTISFDTITLVNSGPPYSDFCLVKYSPSGQVIWAQTSKNSLSSDATYSICTDKTGNVFLTGPYQSESITIGTTTLINKAAPDRNFYIVDYDAAGNVIWVKGLGGINDDAAYAICTDPAGELYAGGYFTSPSIDFGSLTLTNAGIGTTNLFVAKLINTQSPKLTTGSASGEKMSIYPNPFVTATNIQFDPSLDNDVLELFNMFGEKIMSLNHVSGSNIKIDRGNLPSGIYLFLLKHDNTELASGKLIITD